MLILKPFRYISDRQTDGQTDRWNCYIDIARQHCGADAREKYSFRNIKPVAPVNPVEPTGPVEPMSPVGPVCPVAPVPPVLPCSPVPPKNGSKQL